MKRHELAKERFPKRWEQQERKAWCLRHFEYKGFDCYTDSYSMFLYHEKMTDLPLYEKELNPENFVYKKAEYKEVKVIRQEVKKLHDIERQKTREKGERYLVYSYPFKMKGTETVMGTAVLLDVFKFMAERELTFMVPVGHPLKPVWAKNENGDYAIACPINPNYKGH